MSRWMPPDPTQGSGQINRRALLRTLGLGGGLAAAGALEALLGPGARLADAASGDQTTLLVGADLNGIKTLDPGRTIEVTGMMIEKVTYDTLVTFQGEDLRTPRPKVATAWKVSPDGRSTTFTLRPGIKFLSGNALTSADVKWSFDRILTLQANTSFLFDGVEAVVAPDPLTVVIQTKAPLPSLVPILSHPGLGILDSKLVMQNGGDAGPNAKTADHAEPYLNAHSQGSGPFILTSYVPVQQLILDRNPQYWGGPAKLQRIVIKHVPDPVTQALQVVRGDLDVATSIGQDQVAPLRRAPNVTVKTSPAATTFYVLMNNTPDVGGPFSNPKIQQAVRYALDYQGILQIAGPGAVRMAGVIPTLMPGSLDPKLAATTDIAKAKSLVAESGLTEVRGKFSYASDQVRGVFRSRCWRRRSSQISRRRGSSSSSTGCRSSPRSRCTAAARISSASGDGRPTTPTRPIFSCTRRAASWVIARDGRRRRARPRRSSPRWPTRPRRRLTRRSVSRCCRSSSGPWRRSGPTCRCSSPRCRTRPARTSRG